MELSGEIGHVLLITVVDVAGRANVQLCLGDVNSFLKSDLGTFPGLSTSSSSYGAEVAVSVVTNQHNFSKRARGVHKDMGHVAPG